MKRTSGFQFILGVVVGAVLFGGSVAYAAGIMAQPKTAAVVIDGQEVDLKGYIIEGAHYFQLRDLDAALIPGGKDFSVVWDGANNRVLIDTTRGYDPNETLPTQATPTQSEAPAMTIDEMKAEIVRLTNIERVKAGVPELEVLPELMDCAQAKAQDFIDNNYFGHISPVYGTPGEMIRAVIPSAEYTGENLMGASNTPQDAVEGWMTSQGHRTTMLAAKYTHIGVGIVVNANGTYWFVQQFISF